MIKKFDNGCKVEIDKMNDFIFMEYRDCYNNIYKVRHSIYNGDCVIAIYNHYLDDLKTFLFTNFTISDLLNYICSGWDDTCFNYIKRTIYE